MGRIPSLNQHNDSLWKDPLRVEVSFMEDQDEFSSRAPLVIENVTRSLPEDGNGKSLHRCQSCGKGYAHTQSLWNHSKFECGKSPQFHCPICDYESKRKGNLKNHMKSVHSKVI